MQVYKEADRVIDTIKRRHRQEKNYALQKLKGWKVCLGKIEERNFKKAYPIKNFY